MHRTSALGLTAALLLAWMRGRDFSYRKAACP
jgi:hypothetical protein